LPKLVLSNCCYGHPVGDKRQARGISEPVPKGWLSASQDASPGDLQPNSISKGDLEDQLDSDSDQPGQLCQIYESEELQVMFNAATEDEAASSRPRDGEGEVGFHTEELGGTHRAASRGIDGTAA